MTKREYNVDLFRIIATIFVVTLHVLEQGGVLKNAAPNSAVFWVAWFFEIAAYCAVNCFALITGYVTVGRTVKPKRLISLWFQVIFYSMLITFSFFAFLPSTRSLKNLVGAFFPIVGKRWWYISAYFALFCFIPFLNKALDQISQQAHKKFLLIALIAVSCMDCLMPTDAFTMADGYSAVWLMVLYILGAYIKKYNVKQYITAGKSMLGFFAAIFITLLSKFGIRLVTTRLLGEAKLDNLFVTYISITIVLASVFLFLFCLNLRVSECASKCIAFLSPITLGVYIIHVHPLVFHKLLKNAFASFAHQPPALMVLYVLAATLAIFAVCAVIDWLRILLFKWIKIEKWSEKLEAKFNQLCRWVLKREQNRET